MCLRDPLALLPFNNNVTTKNYPLSLHDALPICLLMKRLDCWGRYLPRRLRFRGAFRAAVERILSAACAVWWVPRSEEHTSELQSRGHIVCRLLLEKKNRT